MPHRSDEFANKYARWRSIRDLQQQYPGRAPGGTGLTGLASTDAQGWSDMLNQQTEAINIENDLEGRPPLRIQEAPYQENSYSAQPQSPWMQSLIRKERRQQLQGLYPTNT